MFNGEVSTAGLVPTYLTVGGGVKASPVFDGKGNTYLAGMGGQLSSYTRDGKRRWLVQVSQGISASPVLDPSDRSLFVGTLGGEAYAIDASSGQIHWKQTIPSQSDPRILSDLLFLERSGLVVFNSWGGQFHALTAETGASRFTWSAGICPYASAAASENGTLYSVRVDSAEGRSGMSYVSVDPESESETEFFFQPVHPQAANRAAVAASPVIDDARKRVYVIANLESSSQLQAFCLRTTRILWRRNFERFTFGTPALRADGFVVVSGLDGVVHLISPEGTLSSRYHTGAEYLLAGPVCDESGTIFVGDPEGRLHMISAEGTGRIVFEAQRAIEARSSFDPEGRLYLPSRDGRIYVFP